MKAAAITENRRLALVDKPKPIPGPGQAVVKIERCGICGSDLHGLASGPLLGVLYGAGTVPGHECSGVVDQIGSGITDFQFGDRVAICPVAPCGACPLCVKGQPQLCLNALASCIGLTPMIDGAFAEYLLVANPSQVLFRLPDDMTFETGAMVEVLSNALHAVRVSRFRPGDSVVVLGAGPIGLAATRMLAFSGAGQIIVVEPSAERARLARELGADTVLDPNVEGPALPLKVAELTGGLGADCVFECAGVPATYQNAVHFMRSGGSILVLSVIEHDTMVSPLMFTLKEANLQSSFGYTLEEYKMTLNLLARKKITAESFVSDVIALEDIQTQGFDRLTKEKTAIKILVKP